MGGSSFACISEYSWPRFGGFLNSVIIYPALYNFMANETISKHYNMKSKILKKYISWFPRSVCECLLKKNNNVLQCHLFFRKSCCVFNRFVFGGQQENSTPSNLHQSSVVHSELGFTLNDSFWSQCPIHKCC